jgi:hypothetical protein
MANNLTAPNDNGSLGQYMAACVSAGSTAGLSYPDQSICLYVKAALAAATADVPGAPSLNAAQMMRAILGA